MSVASHSSVLIGITMASLATTAYTHPQWLLREAKRQPIVRMMCLEAVTRSPDEIDARYRLAVNVRFHAKYKVAREVIRGDRSLLEAAECFRQINDHCAAELRESESSVALRDPLTACEQVIVWVDGELRGKNHPQTDEVLCRLEAEMEALRK